VPSADDAFRGLKRVATIEPADALRRAYEDAYGRWHAALVRALTG
jgi:hypothetical protein